MISIHAPRVGSDIALASFAKPIKISIHAPRVGSDILLHLRWGMSQDFNPRSPCGERPNAALAVVMPIQHFNPRSPCGERLVGLLVLLSCGIFQSTLPVWGATLTNKAGNGFLNISIHAPRVGSDGWPHGKPRRQVYFNPRSPCGERHAQSPLGSARKRDFNPRSPCGERRSQAVDGHHHK